ncbi:MAG: hypothetical protein AAF702_00720 [Chloroflexota bacterium]
MNSTIEPQKHFVPSLSEQRRDKTFLKEYIPISTNRSRGCKKMRWLALLLLLLLLSIVPAHQSARADTSSPDELLHDALEKAEQSGTYTLHTSLDQTLTPERSLFIGAQPESAHFELEGKIAGSNRARFTLTPGRATFRMAQAEPQEFLLKDGVAYLRQGERWTRTDGMPGLTGVDRDNLLLVSAAEEVTLLDAPDAPPGLDGLFDDVTRVGFVLRSDAVTDALLSNRGLSPQALTLARLQAPQINGEGELWIGHDGYPARLILTLQWVRAGEEHAEPIHIAVHSETTYSDFGMPISTTSFDPYRYIGTGEPIPEAMVLNWVPIGMSMTVLLFFVLLYCAYRGGRAARHTVTALLLLGLLMPSMTSVVEASGLGAHLRGEDTQAEADASGAFEQMINEVQQIATVQNFDNENPANELDSHGDEDGDGLPNGYELTLGTNPFAEDTDFDGLTDAEEVEGVPCFIDFLNKERLIVSDPVNPDSNHDGLSDGDEYWRDRCYDGSNSVGNVWTDDNDKDGVPDGLDLSPFSSSASQGTHDGVVLGGDWDGANFDFESLDMDPEPSRTRMYPFYVEAQVRPQHTQSLRWAYKNLYWPGDDKGAIQNTSPIIRALHKLMTGNDIGTSGKLTLVPFLSVQVVESDLPSSSAIAEYGASTNRSKDADGDPLWHGREALYDLALPLVPVEEGGQVFAFQTKMLHDQNGSDDLLRRWQDVRLKWAIIGDVLMNNEEGIPVPSSDGGYGLVVYDEPFHVTGLQVQRQGGTSVLVAAHLPEDSSRVPYDDGPIAALRAGMEHKFLGGELGMKAIKDRFNDPSNVTEEERWGIPHSERFRVKHDVTMSYTHLDAALATTTMTTTKELLNTEFGGFENLQPTLLLATEQRTSTVNLDDDWSSDYRTLSLNTCLKPLVTSRSVKLQTYSWGYDGLAPRWAPLSLDEVITKVENDYLSATDPNYEFFDEELSILKLSTTAWYIGQTAVMSIGQQSWQDITKIVSDAKLAVHFLTEDGLFPKEFKKVVFELLKIWEQGGPVEWLKKKWNQIVGYYEQVDGFFTGSYVDYSPAASSVTAIGAEGEGGINDPPGKDAAPIDKKIMGYTETALSVLGMLASKFGGIFQEIVDVLTKLVQIYKKLRKIIDVVMVLVKAAKTGESIADITATVVEEVGKMSKPLSIVGLIFAIGFVWIMTAVQLNDVGPSIALTLVVKAIVETILLVVLFVVATVYPIGTLIALAYGLIKLIEGLIGFVFDPLSLLLDWLFGINVHERAEIWGDPQLGAVSINPREPGGGVLSGQLFRVDVSAITTMRTKNGGTKSDLEQASAQMHVGRWAEGHEYSLCSPDPETYQQYKESLQGYWFKEFHAKDTDCVHFRLPSEKEWTFYPGGSLTATQPELKSQGRWYRDIHSSAWVDVKPSADINGRMVIDVSMNIEIPYDQCSTVGGCDRYIFEGVSAPAIIDLRLDILPAWLPGLWEWDEVRNFDIDGDGLVGYFNPVNGQPIGPDANLCSNKPGASTIEDWDSDDDGLSDKFELETDGFDPCQKDSDGDKLEDGKELRIGTDPSDTDTDNDGLSDYDEVARHSSSGHLVAPWTIDLKGQYPGHTNPPAFPNPLQSNRDGDHRKDGQEKKKLTSPNAFNAIPIGEPLNLSIGQSLQPGGGTKITINTGLWENDEVAAINASLTVSMPVALNDLSKTGVVKPLSIWSEFNQVTEQSTGNPNVHRWTLSPLFLNRYAQVTLAGTPVLPSQPVSITASLEYNVGTTVQTSRAEVPLLVNAGGPEVTIVGVSGGVILEEVQAASAGGVAFYAQANSPVVVQGTAADPQRVKQVYACLVSSGSCSDGDWKLANGRNTWSYSFTPSADGTYVAHAYGIDTYGLSGPTATANLGIDRTKPNAISLDLSGTVYLSTNNNTTDSTAPGLPVVTISGQASDATGPAFVSGVDKIGVSVDGSRELHMADVEMPGAPSSRFNFDWSPPLAGFGRAQRLSKYIADEGNQNLERAYNLVFGVQDAAGNASDATATLNIVIDDTPPVVRLEPPQISDIGIKLSGLADDTASILDRQPTDPFSPTLTTAESDTQLTLLRNGKSIIVPDVNGDTIDDLLLLVPPTSASRTEPFRAGLFFGRPGGFAAALTLNEADVQLVGELPVDLFDFPPDGAGLGDVNGDGVGDLLLGDPSGQSGAGIAYVVLGQRDAWPATINLADADWRITQRSTLGFGGSVSPAGDVNGDGLVDFLVGAASTGRTIGPVWLYMGQETAPKEPVAHHTFVSPSGASTLPPKLAGLGDTDGDGLSDFLIAAENAPVAFVRGRPDAEWTNDLVNLGNIADALIDGQGNQQTVAPAGDVNGDGLADALIGDPDATPSAVYLLYGRRLVDALDKAPVVTAIDDATDASFVQAVGVPSTQVGAGLTTLGDVDGDGQDDFAFGEPGNGRGASRAAIVLTRQTVLQHNLPVPSATYLISGTGRSLNFGSLLSSGDVTGDHLPDLLGTALSEQKAHLFRGRFDPGRVAGVEQVEIGLFGPMSDYTAPPTSTIPTNWQTVSLNGEWHGIRTWNGQLTAPSNGDYRLYARATDRAGNVSPDLYMGIVHVQPAPTPFANADVSMDKLVLTDKTDLTLGGAFANELPQYLRAWNGHSWKRLPPVVGNWQWNSEIPLHDFYTEVYRVVGRDAFGATAHASQAQRVDTLVEAPVLSADLPIYAWHTDAAPTLNLTWSTPEDTSGIVEQWATIDTDSQSVSTAPAKENQLTQTLEQPGVYWAHVRVQDEAGNLAIARSGPFLFNRSSTPSVILPDGLLDRNGGEYPTGTLLNYDPYASNKSAALWGTWNSEQLFLGIPGRPWGDGNQLALYLDTQGGGLNSSLSLFGSSHTLPFDADYALVVGGSPEQPVSLYQASGNWTMVSDPQSFAVQGTDTEIVLDRNEIGATGSVRLLAYGEDEEGVWMVLPGGARADVTSPMTGSLTFGEGLSWASLSDGAQPGAGQAQVIAPVVTLLPALRNSLIAGESTTFQLTIHNPDVGDYVNEPISLTVDSMMTLQTIDGAQCSSCPAGVDEWELLADVAAGETQTVTIQAQMQGNGQNGIHPVAVRARLKNSGLLRKPQAATRSEYVLDQGQAVMRISGGETQYRQAGQSVFTVLPSLSRTALHRCFSQVEVNTGGGWKVACGFGDCFNIEAFVNATNDQEWQVRTVSEDGRKSEMHKVRVVEDSIAPSVEISPTLVFSGSRGALTGLAWDTFPTTRAPERVEVSLDGGPFQSVLVSKQPVALQRGAVNAASTLINTTGATWRMPLEISRADGRKVEVVARAVDEAGNVGSESEPVFITLDTVGPSLSVSLDGDILKGEVSDGSGVASLMVSLDGGAHYQPVQVDGGTFSFNLADWNSGSQQTLGLIRATDIYGNARSTTFPLMRVLEPEQLLYLPLISHNPFQQQVVSSSAEKEVTSTLSVKGTDFSEVIYMPVVRQ